MPKFKASRGRRKTQERPPAALSCVILVIAAMFLVMFFLYEAMKHANG